jgi:5-methylcytosine-specific restriction endonuclease McrA
MPEPNWKIKRIKLSKHDYSEQREDIFCGQDGYCAGCGHIKPLTRQHITKRSQLGGDERSNASGLCAECHRRADEYADRIKGRYGRNLGKSDKE